MQRFTSDSHLLALAAVWLYILAIAGVLTTVSLLHAAFEALL